MTMVDENIKRVLIKIKPLEPYFFGDENSIKFDNSNSYYVTSMAIPSAMTILGMLRFTVLEQANLLKTDRNYSDDAYDNIKKIIGESSFDTTKEEYGVIKGVSPLFLMDGENIYIKLPLNHKAETKDSDGKKTKNTNYTPMRVDCKMKTSFGDITLPADGEFDPKNTVSDEMYMNIDTGEIDGSIFKTFTKVTCKKQSDKEGFLKKDFKYLKEGFCFAVVVEFDKNTELSNSICYMGREKSAFKFEVFESLESFENFDLVKRINNGSYIKTLYNEKENADFQYALSDIILSEKLPDYKNFAMVTTKNLRYLSTVDKGRRIVRSATLHNVINAGSVFYGKIDIGKPINDKFGVNKIMTFGK